MPTNNQSPLNSTDEIGKLAGSFVTMRQNLRELISQLAEKSNQTNDLANTMSQSTNQVSQASSSTAATIMQISASSDSVRTGPRSCCQGQGIRGVGDQGAQNKHQMTTQLTAMVTLT